MIRITCLEKFWLEHPELAPKGKCPHEFGYLPEKPWDCYERACWECWMQEVIEKPSVKKEGSQ